jgi:isochorismate synthase
MGSEPQHQYTLDTVFKAAIAQHHPIALWRLPNTATIQACVSLQPGCEIDQLNLEQSPFGFLFCPFQLSDQHQNLFIKGDLLYNTATDILTTALDAPPAKLEQFNTAMEQEQETTWHAADAAAQHSYQTECGFISAVSKAIEAIGAGLMEKVVMSRNYLEQLPAVFNPITAFKTIMREYPGAFVSLVSIPGVGTWMGASPEILVSINEEKIFHTVALAGTQPAANAGSVAQAIWRQKEIEEQAMVERYILKCFKALRLREYDEVGPRTIIAGNLMHLRTDFKVDLKEVDFPTLGTDMLRLLHPTSAVCGLPKEPALQFILEHEGYNRSYYSGFLGPVNCPTGTHLYVNLRCMELLQKEVILYAGAGVTAESNPEKEWQETQHKMQTMRRILAQF